MTEQLNWTEWGQRKEDWWQEGRINTILLLIKSMGMKNLGDTMRISGWGNCLMGISNIPWDRTFWKRSRYARSRLGTEWDTVFSVLEVVWVQRHKRNWIIIFMSLQSFRDPYFWVLEILYVYDFLIFFLKFLFVVVDHFKSLCWICYNISSVLCFFFFFFFFLLTGHERSHLPDQGSNLHSLHWKVES